MCQQTLLSEAYFRELEDSTSDLNGREDLKLNGLSNVIPTPKPFLESIGPQPRFMMTLRASILKIYQESTYSQEDSLVKTSAMLEKELASRGVVLHSGNITCEPLAKYDHDSQSLKMLKHLGEKDLKLSSPILPRSGMMLNGIVYRLPPLVRLTVATGYSSFATPTTMDFLPPKSETALLREATITRKNRSKPANLRDQVSNMQNWPTPTVSDVFTHKLKSSQIKEGSRHSLTLGKAVQMFPTPAVRDYKDNASPSEFKRHTPSTASMVGGALNPNWVEWLMGFPIGFTELNDLETQSFLNLHKQSRKQSSKKCK